MSINAHKVLKIIARSRCPKNLMKIDRLDLNINSHSGNKINLYKAISDQHGDNIDGFGVCLGQMACTTCMVKFKNDNDAKIANSLCDTKEEEIDMMDTNEKYEPSNCRLACQLKFTKDDLSKFRGDIELVGIE